MKRLPFLVALLLVSVAPIAAEEAEQRHAEIRAMCEAEWPGDYRMQEHCINQHTAAFGDVSRFAAQVDDGSDDAMVLATCASEWQAATGGHDWRMTRHCIDRQIEARQAVSLLLADFAEGSEERRLVERCAQEWRTGAGGYDWRMVRHCSDRQLASLRRLRGG